MNYNYTFTKYYGKSLLSDEEYQFDFTTSEGLLDILKNENVYLEDKNLYTINIICFEDEERRRISPILMKGKNLCFELSKFHLNNALDEKCGFKEIEVMNDLKNITMIVNNNIKIK